ncbi:glycosyltransferase [Oryzomonas japonica]|uniref:Glycosyltransferase n=1 Tax=Oryzomonas japonica TaxID=2603858 RepID=A0A7J4ZTJ2_9BACT|nr:glycosyltransferase [Oryzomonas japonica]KAB0666525.1 glycosyltransferase [Oryzomonas japonica]
MSKQLTEPVVSVCIPSYEGAEFIGAAIESVLAQSFHNFELIIIDDSSTDGTDRIVSNYNDPRIKFLRNDRNLGPEGNWNRCIAEARGRYIKLLPQDDLLAPHCLARQVAVLEADTDERIALVFCARTIFDSHGRTIMSRGYPKRRDGTVGSQSAIRTCLRRGANIIGEPGGVLFRKSLANEVGGFDASIGYIIDLDYWFRLLLRGNAYYLTEKLVSFRVSSGSWSVAIGNGQGKDFQHFVARAATNPAFGIGRIDIIAGKVMGWTNNLLRMCVYQYILKTK